MRDLSVQTSLGTQGQGNSNVPQTPAQQVLISPADRWGLLGLLAVIRSADPDTALLGMGTDLGAVGLDMGNLDNLYSALITPWSDASAALAVEPDFHVPACYNVQPTLPGPTKAASFSDETLFWMFYSSPRDVLQEVAAQELYNRNWRFHKDNRLWLTKESGTAPSVKTATYERGIYTFFDPENWERVKKDSVIVYDLLEEKIPMGGVLGGVPVGGPQQQGPPPPPPGMNVLGPGAGPNQTQPQLPQQQQQHPTQHQLHQQQLVDARHRHSELQGMQNPRYPGVGTPGLGL
ncbi:uncharacterized protein EI90DRAFT_2916367 [Cantharellus anzutake]|uniref:uncharacterized protein n=1 Tax=Cantharellus anzutake TaxID=1750568 RepID=UPI0019061862|nr:uncharacterized protein EI90DRAFT_2916367 [Cantharellus anzutake]KAF8333569.1 hypothetical protein EI90DRAFT_2916367 [Cantharellus anzutake]